MSLENILNEIESTTEMELKQIRDEYTEKMANVTMTCNEKLSRIKQDYTVKSENDIKNIIRQSEDSIKLQSKKIIDDRKKEILNNTMQRLKSYVLSLNKSSNYPELLKAMLIESEKELGKKFTVYCSENDKDKLESLKFSDSVKFEVDKTIKSGILSKSEDGKKEADMRLISIFDSVSYDIETYLYENIK